MSASGLAINQQFEAMYGQHHGWLRQWLSKKLGDNTALLIDADTGAPRGHWLPAGGASGNTVSNWMGALHMAHVFGLPYRIFVALLGIAVSALSITGALIWWKKRHARASSKATRQVMA